MTIWKDLLNPGAQGANAQDSDLADVSETRDVPNEIEFRLILEAIYLRYGYDFRSYAESSMHRRLNAVLGKFLIDEPLKLLAKILQDPAFFRSILSHLTIITSEMFRDPEFFKSLREDIFPHLRTHPSLNFWIAGCSTGEEVYSLAILLKEENLYDRSVVFATDINPKAIKAAREGIYSVETMKTHTKNYHEAGGADAFNRYYTADYGHAKMKSELLANVVFSEHNLVHDHVFAECHLILCRNVLIYFNRDLQDRAVLLFLQSLRYGGFLGIGSKESLRFSVGQPAFDVVNEKWRIYRRNGIDAQSLLGGGLNREWS